MEFTAFVLGATQWLKDHGVPSKWLPYCAILLGGLFAASLVISSPGEVLALKAGEGALWGGIATGIVSLAKGELNKRSLKK